MLLRLTVLLLLLTPILTFGQKTQVARDLNVKEFQKQMTAHPGILLDVRTAGEVKKGAIPNAVNIDIFDDEFETKIETLDKSKPVYIYCAVGGRSAEAMDMMKKKGFIELYNLSGGYSAWQKANK
jgi:phage shock protein E